MGNVNVTKMIKTFAPLPPFISQNLSYKFIAHSIHLCSSDVLLLAVVVVAAAVVVVVAAVLKANS
jgi:hypothetical protein